MMTIREERKQCLEHMKHIPKEYLLPRKKATGMKDIVWKDGMGYGYLQYWYMIRENSELQIGGRLKPVDWIDGCGCIADVDMHAFVSLMRTYEMYLCTDGAIRCVCTPELDKQRWDLEDQLYNAQFAAWDESFKAEGYEWIDDEGCWKHPETGDIIYAP